LAISFTPKQQQVIELHNCNILVSAAAGSGKTAVLVERIVQMVCDAAHPVDIDRLLIVTFTNAAAAEMRERIAAGIARMQQEHPEDEHIERQATLLHNAQITTIDSFSLFLVRNHFNEIGLDPAFRVADEGEIKLLAQDVLEELLEEAYAGKDEAFTYCVEYFCPGGREKVLEEYILDLSRYAASFPWPGEWLLARKKDYEAGDWESLSQSDWVRYLCDHIKNVLEGCLEKLRLVQNLCESPDGPYMYGALVDDEIEQVERLLESAPGRQKCKNVSEADKLTKSLCIEPDAQGKCDRNSELEWYAARIPAVTFGRLPSKKDDSVSPEKRELAKELRSQVKETLQKLSESFFATPLPLALEQGKACAAPVSTLIDLVLEFDRRMKEKKQERKLIDFSDMEHYALEILLDREGDTVRPSHVALEYRQYFHEILIDEYQDSNLVQEYLLQAISGEDEGRFNRFMVGDVKQSIYKFRLARPELFLEKYDTYKSAEEEQSDADSAKSSGCRRIDLARNFRSRRQVVDTVNEIFSRIMRKEIGGIEYDEKAALYPGAVYPENEDCTSELLLVEKPGKEKLGKEKAAVNGSGSAALSEAEDVAIPDSKQAEALAIAEKILDLKQHFRVTDKATGQLRPVRYADMVILLRTSSGWDEEFKKMLEEEGIPVYITTKTGYFAATEVQELLNFLRILDNPFQDIPLYGVLKSLFGGFAEAEIASIRAAHKGCSLYEAMRTWADQGGISTEGEREASEGIPGMSIQGDLQKKICTFLDKLEKYRDCTAYMPIRDLLQKIVTDYDYLNYVTALPAGGKRRANVEMLFTKASDFEKTSYFGLFHFVRYIEQLEKYDVDMGEADLLDENADVVRIMSIHKSKGLEFPVTFVAGLAKRFNMQDANQSLIVDMDLGLATDYVNPEKRIRNKTLRRMTLARKMREDNLAEELRILYVALTRAREKLILTGVLEKAEEQWEQMRVMGKERLSYLDFVEAGSYLDFLMPILGQTGVQVTVTDTAALLGGQFKEQLELAERRKVLERAEDFADKEALEFLKKQFAYRYPHRGLANLYTKTTVSELKIAAMAQKDEAAYHAFEEKEVVPYIPAFKRETESVSGTVRGNAYHRVMELLDFEELLGALFAEFPKDYESYREVLAAEQAADTVKDEVQSLKVRLQHFLLREKESLRLNAEYFEAVNLHKLLHFLESRLAYRMWAAQRRGDLYREQPFVLGIDARRLGQDFPEGEKVLIQGIIDVFFVEDGQLVLLDYKTDVISSMEELWNRYAVQLDYYEEALSRLMEMPVKEKILYSFYLECF